MRGKRKVGRILASILTTVMLVTSMPTTVYATEQGKVTNVPNGQEEVEAEESVEETESPEEKDGSEDSGEFQEAEEPVEKEEEKKPGEEDPSDENEPEEQEKSDFGNESEDSEKEPTNREEDTEEVTDTEKGEEEESPEEKPDEESISQNTAEDDLPLTPEGEQEENISRTDLQSTFIVKGRDSVGRMLSDVLEGKTEEQIQSNGYNVFAVEMSGQTAKVSFETRKDAVLTVAIYDEEGKRLLASGNSEVIADQRNAEVEIAEIVPQYFHVRSFLTDRETLQPLCPLYDSPMYTREMQEFLTKTTDDFEEDRVLNLDDDKTNNFAVYNEETILIPDKENVNVLVSGDEEKNIYVFENADESITALKPGDIFAYEYMDGYMLIVKVAKIEVDGTTASIIGEELSMEEVFDYVKIDSKEGLGTAEIDASNLEDGVSYEGIMPYSEGEVETYKWGEIDEEWSKEVAASYKFSQKVLGDDVKISGSLKFKMKSSLKVYLTFKYQYMEVKFDYSMTLQGNLTAGRKNEDAFQIPLASVRIDFFPGVYIKLTPKFVIEAEGNAEVSGTLKGTVGGAVSSDEGARNLTSAPKFESDCKAEISVFVGLSLEPEIAIIHDTVAVVALDASAGVEVKAKYSVKTPSTSKIHECVACIEGGITGKIGCKFKAKLLNKIRVSKGH